MNSVKYLLVLVAIKTAACHSASAKFILWFTEKPYIAIRFDQKLFCVNKVNFKTCYHFSLHLCDSSETHFEEKGLQELALPQS